MTHIFASTNHDKMNIDNNRPIYTLTVSEFKSLLAEMRGEPTPTPEPARPDDDDLLTAQELAERLNVTLMTLWRWRRNGNIPPSRSLGRRIYFRWSEVMAAMQK